MIRWLGGWQYQYILCMRYAWWTFQTGESAQTWPWSATTKMVPPCLQKQRQLMVCCRSGNKLFFGDSSWQCQCLDASCEVCGILWSCHPHLPVPLESPLKSATSCRWESTKGCKTFSPVMWSKLWTKSKPRLRSLHATGEDWYLSSTMWSTTFLLKSRQRRFESWECQIWGKSTW